MNYKAEPLPLALPKVLVELGGGIREEAVPSSSDSAMLSLIYVTIWTSSNFFCLVILVAFR